MNMKQIITENISIFISVVAFMLSMWQLVLATIKKRTNISIVLENIQQFKEQDCIKYVFIYTLVNKSDAPINITRMFISDNKYKKEYSCSLNHSWVGERYYPKSPENDIPRTERILSVDFPISLVTHGATMVHIKFVTDTSFSSYKVGDIVDMKVITDKKTKLFKLRCQRQDNAKLVI